jgi:hypothetical protein
MSAYFNENGEGDPLFSPGNFTSPAFGNSSSTKSIMNLLAERAVITQTLVTGKPGEQRTPELLNIKELQIVFWSPSYFYKDIINRATITNGAISVDLGGGAGATVCDMNTLISSGFPGPQPAAQTKTGNKKYFGFENLSSATNDLWLPANITPGEEAAGDYEGQEIVIINSDPNDDLDNSTTTATVSAAGIQGWYEPDGTSFATGVRRRRAATFCAMTIPENDSLRYWYLISTSQ